MFYHLTYLLLCFVIDDTEVLRYLPKDERSLVVGSIYGNNLLIIIV